MALPILTNTAYAQEGDDAWIKSGTGMLDKLIAAVQTYSLQIAVLGVIATLITAAVTGQGNWPRILLIIFCGVAISITPAAMKYLTTISL